VWCEAWFAISSPATASTFARGLVCRLHNPTRVASEVPHGTSLARWCCSRRFSHARPESTRSYGAIACPSIRPPAMLPPPVGTTGSPHPGSTLRVLARASLTCFRPHAVTSRGAGVGAALASISHRNAARAGARVPMGYWRPIWRYNQRPPHGSASGEVDATRRSARDRSSIATGVDRDASEWNGCGRRLRVGRVG